MDPEVMLDLAARILIILLGGADVFTLGPRGHRPPRRAPPGLRLTTGGATRRPQSRPSGFPGASEAFTRFIWNASPGKPLGLDCVPVGKRSVRTSHRRIHVLDPLSTRQHPVL